MKRTALAIVSLLLLAFAPAAFAQNHTEPLAEPTAETPTETPAEVTAAQDSTNADGAEAEHQAKDDGHEAGGHEKGDLLPTIKQGLAAMITAFIVFGLVFFILKSKAWPIIAGGLEDRDNKIRSEIIAAEKARQDAKDALLEYEVSLNESRAEAKKILDETKAYQQQLAADLKSKADAELTIMKDRARRDIDAAKKTAITEIYTEAMALSTLMAGKILKRQVNDADSTRLLQETLAELPKIN